MLVVDDEPSITLALSAKLKRDGHECRTAASGEEAFERFRDDGYDLVVTDVRMPGMSGIDLLKKVKASDPEVQVIVMTAYAEVNFAVEALRLNADDYLLKPFDIDELSHSVSRALEHRRLVRENRAYREHLEQRVKEQADRIEKLFLEGLVALAGAIEARDPYTGGHLEQVTKLALAVGTELNLEQEQMRALWLAALFHDVGKLAIPDSILNKPGKLTSEEYDLMKAHVERGLRVIEGVSYLEPAIPGILHHHERWDGGGYPNGLAAGEISLEGRILSVVDAFDAMLGDRPYRKGRSPEAALEELQRCAGTQFDPEIVAAFIRAREKGFQVHAPGIPLRPPSAKA